MKISFEFYLEKIIAREYLLHMLPVFFYPVFAFIFFENFYYLIMTFIICLIVTLYSPLLYNYFPKHKQEVDYLLLLLPQKCQNDFAEFEKLFAYTQFKHRGSFLRRIFKSVYTFLIFMVVTVSSKYFYDNVSIIKIFENLDFKNILILFILFGPISLLVLDFGKIVSGEFIVEKVKRDLYIKISKSIP